MRRKTVTGFFILIGAVVLLCSGAVVWAQPPAIDIELSFDKSFYGFEEPVGMEVSVRNDETGDRLISSGFNSKVFYLEMRVIDPAGRLLLAQRDDPLGESVDPGPLGWVLYDGRPIQVGPCEVLPSGWTTVSRADDLGAHYDMSLPGYYSAQVQVSAMVYRGAPGDYCNVDDYQWLGVLKSETKYFYLEGDTKVEVVPDKWRLKWKAKDKGTPKVKVKIWVAEGQSTGDYNLQSIRLNNVAPTRVKAVPPKIEAFFEPNEAIASLGEVEVGQWYPVVVSGRYSSGAPFGGSRQVKIVR